MSVHPGDPTPPPEADWAQELRTLARYDWVTLASARRLHHAVTFEVDVEGWCYLNVVTACGLRRDQAWIPGVFTRMSTERCTRCCDVSGYPHGTGSPKNDEACRDILGLPNHEPPTPTQEMGHSQPLRAAAAPAPVDDGPDVFGGANLTACPEPSCGCQPTRHAQ